MKKALLSLLALAVVGLIAYTTLFDRNAAPQVSYTSLGGQQILPRLRARWCW